jgi:hypothetical protein
LYKKKQTVTQDVLLPKGDNFSNINIESQLQKIGLTADQKRFLVLLLHQQFKFASVVQLAERFYFLYFLYNLRKGRVCIK